MNDVFQNDSYAYADENNSAKFSLQLLLQSKIFSVIFQIGLCLQKISMADNKQ